MREAKDAQNIFSAVLIHGARLSVRSGRPTRPALLQSMRRTRPRIKRRMGNTYLFSG